MDAWKGNAIKQPPPGAWIMRQNDLLNELDTDPNKCDIKINQPMTIYLKSPVNGYLRSDNFGKPEFSKDVKKPYITGWNILMKYKDGKEPKWLKKHRGLIKSYDNYYTKVIEGRACYRDQHNNNKYDTEKLKIPKEFKKSTDFTAANCAKLFRDWQLTNGLQYKLFAFLPLDSYYKENKCLAIKSDKQCLGLQETNKIPKNLTDSDLYHWYYSFFKFKGGNNIQQTETENNIQETDSDIFGGRPPRWTAAKADKLYASRLSLPQFITYKLDNEYDSL
jgi:hypothetical protein